MNSVREQWSKQLLKQCTEPKNWLGAPSAQPAGPRRAHGTLRPRVRTRSGAVSWPYGRPCRKPSGRIVVVCRTQARPCRGIGRDTAPYLMPLPVTIHYNVLRYRTPSSQALLSQYNSLYCDTNFSQASPPVTIQLTVS